MSSLYLCGPMTGLPNHNFDAFHAAAARLRDLGHEVVNPAENDGGDTSKPWEYYLRKDLGLMLGCEAVAVLPGWESSRGATLEVHVARALSMPILSAATLEPYHDPVTLEANRLVSGARNKDYGHPAVDMGRTGRMWAAILGLSEVSAEKVALCMIALKISRQVNAPKRDNMTDACGYAQCVDEIVRYEAVKKAE